MPIGHSTDREECSKIQNQNKQNRFCCGKEQTLSLGEGTRRDAPAGRASAAAPSRVRYGPQRGGERCAVTGEAPRGPGRCGGRLRGFAAALGPSRARARCGPERGDSSFPLPPQPPWETGRSLRACAQPLRWGAGIQRRIIPLCAMGVGQKRAFSKKPLMKNPRWLLP